MSAIITPVLDIEHWSVSNDTGPLTMFNAMQNATKSSEWTDRKKSIDALIAWWTRVPCYDPDMEPEGLIQRLHLTSLSKEVLGIAAAHRIRPDGLSWDMLDTNKMKEWLVGSQAQTLRTVLEIEKTGSWWNRCLFEHSDTRYHARTEQLVSALMTEHLFVHMAAGLQVPLVELLPMLNDTCTPPSTSDSPELPDLC